MKLFNNIENYISNIKIETNSLKYQTDDELKLRIEKIKKREKTESLDNLLVDWFALVQEISFRKIGLRHFDTQLTAGIFLHQGKIVEMKTGEGKTLASTLPVSLNALTGKGVHVVTVNDYLAERDKNWMGKIYKELELTVGLIKTGSELFEKQQNYSCDITYLTNSELVFDYLRDSSALFGEDLVQRPFNYCIIDEIDSILIDEARTPLILSTPQGISNLKKLSMAKLIAAQLEKNIDFELDEKRREIYLLENGYSNVKEKLGKKSLYDIDDPWILDILNALKAKYLFKLNKDYIVLNKKIAIVDEFTGRIMEDRRWSLGIHEAIEMKENVEIGAITKTKTSITYQNFFPLYPKLCGMTGTGKTAEKEFKDIYNLNVVVLSTAKPMVRKDLSDFVYQTEFSKWKAVAKKARECYEQGQPILIGTASVEKSEFLSDLFKISNLPHQVLNAKPENINRESEIVAQAGEQFAITIATNMAGRGTDIILGGNPNFKVKQILNSIFFESKSIEKILETSNFLQKINEESFKTKLIEQINLICKEYNLSDIFKQNQINELEEIKDIQIQNLKKDIMGLPYSLDTCLLSLKNCYEFIYKIAYQKWEEQNTIVKNLGGLFVLGTERHETRRIDNQLRGRAGRQGDPGFSQFYISLDDELIKIFGGDKISSMMRLFISDMDTPLESNYLTQSLEQAQEKVESYNYDIRKNVFQYDEIINLQRKQLFQIRKEILKTQKYNDLPLTFVEYTLDNEIKDSLSNKKSKIPLFNKFEIRFRNYSSKQLIKKNQHESKINTSEFLKKYSTFLKNKNHEKLSNNFKLKFYSEIWVSTDLIIATQNSYQPFLLENTQSVKILNVIDDYWTEHIERMNYIRETVNWRSYGQQNPLVEYNFEASRSYLRLLDEIRKAVIYFYFEKPLLHQKFKY